MNKNDDIKMDLAETQYENIIWNNVTKGWFIMSPEPSGYIKAENSLRQ